MARSDQALIGLYRSFVREATRQQETFRLALEGKYSLDNATPRVNRGGAWYCLIRLHDAWAHFCCEALWLSAEGGVRTKQGLLLSRSTALQAGDDAFRFLKREWQKTKQPYRWQKQGPPVDIPAVAIIAARLLSITNYTQFAAGIGAATTAPIELKACRNFLAHRHADTATHPDVRALRLRINAPAATICVDALPARPMPNGVTLFEEWCIDLMAMAGAAID